jgi:DNA-binding HxlR family transcriptional regulator
MSATASSGNPRLLFQRLGEKWTIPLLDALSEHAHRYSEIKKRFPLTSKVLSRTLVALQNDGLVTRVESPVVRRSVTYELTQAGRKLVEFVRTFDPDVMPEGPPTGRPAPAQAPGGLPVAIPSGDGAHPLNPMETDLEFRFVTIATGDLRGFAERLAPALGLTAPLIHDFPVAMPDGEDVDLRLCRFQLQGFSVSLAQPLASRLPHAAFLAKHGAGIHHLGFHTSANLDTLIPALSAKGGTWTVGRRGIPYAQLDFQEQLGAALGLSSTAGRPTPVVEDQTAVPLSGSRDLLVHHRVTNVGIVVRSVEDTARAFSDIFGLGVSPMRAVDLALPGISIVGHGAARIAYLRLNGVAIKLIEPLSEGPLADVLERHGNRAHHLGFDVGRSFSAVLARLEGLGGRILLGRRDLGYTLVDFGDACGLVLELSGTPAHA